MKFAGLIVEKTCGRPTLSEISLLLAQTCDQLSN